MTYELFMLISYEKSKMLIFIDGIRGVLLIENNVLLSKKLGFCFFDWREVTT